jgi:hypothetical protein
MRAYPPSEQGAVLRQAKRLDLPFGYAKRLFSDMSQAEHDQTGDSLNDLYAVRRRRYFSERTLEPKQWFDNANRLMLALNLIEPNVQEYWRIFNKDAGSSEKTPEYNCHLIYLMLAGYAIENLCKGFLASNLSHQDHAAIKQGKYPGRLATHNIPLLVDWTGLQTDEMEKQLLSRIQVAVVWRGRYPMPKESDKISPFVEIGSDLRRIELFLMKLHRHVGAKLSYRVGSC